MKTIPFDWPTAAFFATSTGSNQASGISGAEDGFRWVKPAGNREGMNMSQNLIAVREGDIRRAHGEDP
jgi:hypothetical protein